MTFGMRVRLWARQAPQSHLAAAAVVVSLVAGLLAVAVVPRGDSLDTDSSLAVGSGDIVVGEGPQPFEPTSGDGTSAKAPAGGIDGGGGVDAPSSSGESGSVEAGPFPDGATPAEGSAPAEGAAPSPSATAATAAQEPRRASDVGVTADTIKLGFLIAQVGGLDAAGFALGLRGDIDKVIGAYVDDVNKRGGIHGRKVVWVALKVDPLSQSSQRAACLKMTEDEKVFAVLDSASTLGAAQLCYGAEHKVPYFNTGISTVSAEYVKRSFPYQVSTSQNGSRQVMNWARYVGEDGGFKNQTLGVLSDECAPGSEIIDRGLKPVLAEYGVKSVEVRLSCDANTAQQQIPNAVLQMRRAGVTLVFPATIFTNVQLFLQQAEAQRWKPKYSASDYYGMSLDLFTKNFPAGQWDGTAAVTAGHAGEPAAGKPFPAPTQQCNKIVQAAGLDPIDNYDEDSEAIVHCDSVRLFAAAAAAAGANPTRLAWAEAVQRLGDFPSAFSAKAIFRPGKTEGGDALALIQWQASCRCYKQVRPHDRNAYA